MFWKKKYDISLGWESRDDRIEEYSLVMLVDSKKILKKKSPYKYTVGDVDCGISYTGKIDGSGELNGKSIKVTIPDYEIKDIVEGDRLKLDVINDTTCISVVKI